MNNSRKPESAVLSVLLVTYNHKRTVLKAFKSIISQRQIFHLS
jgi:hypothetical protein